MITPMCPKCRQVIPEADVNVANDVAFCRHCNVAEKITAMLGSWPLSDDADLGHPPSGTWYRDDGFKKVIGGSRRSIGKAFGTLAIALFWNGIVSIFVLLAISGTLSLLHVPMPTWFPAPKMNGGPMSSGMVIFLWLFLSPFILIGLAMIWAFVSSLGGRTEVTITPSEGRVFVGIGNWGWRKSFNPQSVRNVRIDQKITYRKSGDTQSSYVIIIDLLEGETIKFGSMLEDSRMGFVGSALRKALGV